MMTKTANESFDELLERYKKKHGILVKPVQGWLSLHPKLYLAYSMGRKRGFTDLGTYVDKPGDHGIGPPAFAFDLGRWNRFYYLGWNYIIARRLVKLYVEYYDPLGINYVILGNKIWSRAKPYWHYYGPDRSHYSHIHVSGVHN